MSVAILDIDGTLVDTNYQHAIAWYRAFRAHGFVVQLWKIHRHIGMGGDQLVASLVGEDADKQHGDGIRDAEKSAYAALIDEVAPLEGARELIAELKERGHTVILASSAKADEADHYVDLLVVRDLVDGWTTSADVEQTKPEARPRPRGAREGRRRRRGHDRRLDLGLRGGQTSRHSVNRSSHGRLQPRGTAGSGRFDGL